MLASFCDDRLTDKNTIHSYVDAYEELFKAKRFTATNILEIGIGPYQPNGGSIKMWADYFPIDQVNPDLFNHSRIFLHTSNDAYNKNFFTNTFLSKGMKFDIMIDDGPHTLESMVYFITMYSQLLKEDGIMVVEDVQQIGWTDILRACTPDALKPYIEVQDRRGVKGRYDDILFIINKSRKNAVVQEAQTMESNQYRYE
jgi:hypothetical protein